MAKQKQDITDFTEEELKEIKDLYNTAKKNFSIVRTFEEIASIANHINAYEFSRSEFMDEVCFVFIATDNTEPNTLQGIRICFSLERKNEIELSPCIDIFLVDDEYPFEEYDVENNRLHNPNEDLTR